MAFIGCPVVGDTVYGFRKQRIRLKRHFLHAARLTFDHPTNGERLVFELPLPVGLQELRIYCDEDRFAHVTLDVHSSTKVFDVPLEPRGKIQVRVQKNGGPVQGATVFLTPLDGQSLLPYYTDGRKTYRSGRRSFTVCPPGGYRVRVVWPDGADAEQEVEVVAGETSEVTFP